MSSAPTLAPGQTTTQGNQASPQPAAAPAAASSPSLIVTSNTSRNNYAQNVNTLTAAQSAANAAMTKSGNYEFANGSTGSTNTTPGGVTTVARNQTPGTQTNTAPGAGTTTVAPDGTTTVAPAVPAGGATAAPAPAGGTTAAPATGDGSSTTGGTSSTGGLDPATQKIYDDNNAQLESNVQSAYSTLASVSATMNNDPAALQAVSLIQAQYGQLYDAMVAKNKILMGRSNQAVAAFGGLGTMSSDFLGTEVGAASDRLAKIVTDEINATLKSNAAFKAGDVKAFNDATTALKDAQKAKTNGLIALSDATSKAQSAALAQQKADAADQKQTFVDMNTYANSSAAGISAATAGMNASDKAAFINSFVKQTASSMGLSDAEAQTFLGMINGQTTKTDQTATKDANSNANIQSEITSRTQAAQIAATKAANSGTANPAVKFDKPTTTALTTAGLSGADIKVLGQALYLYPAQSIIDNPKTPPAAVGVLESLYGLTKTASSTSQ